MNHLRAVAKRLWALGVLALLLGVSLLGTPSVRVDWFEMLLK